MGKMFLVTLGAVFVGILIYARVTAKKDAPRTQFPLDPASNGLFQGPDVDPESGAYLNPGAKPGTVGFGTEKM